MQPVNTDLLGNLARYGLSKKARPGDGNTILNAVRATRRRPVSTTENHDVGAEAAAIYLYGYLANRDVARPF